MMFFRFLYVLICVVPLCPWCVYAEPALEANEVQVMGQRSEVRRMNRGGATVVLRPQSSSANDISLFLASDPTVSGVEAGFYSFRIPLFRGHDSRETSLYLSGVKLFDPLTAMPLLEDVELRMFDRVTIHKGLTPWDLPGADRGGVLDFSFDSKVNQAIDSSMTVSKEEIGTEIGSERLAKLWAKSKISAASGSQIFFASRKSWIGDYTYFDDQGTVLNRDDDQVEKMKENSGQSTQFSGYLSHQDQKHTTDFFVASFVRESGYPDVLNHDRNTRRLASKTNLFLIKSSFEMTKNIELGGSLSGLETDKGFQERIAEVSSTRNERKNSAGRGTLFGKAMLQDLRLMTQWSTVKADVSLESNQGNIQLSPVTQEFSVGLLMDLEHFSVESKSEVILGQNEVLKRSFGLSLGYSLGPSMVWSQLVSHNRRASLLETYGDGGAIEASNALHPEALLGSELGLRWNRTDIGSSWIQNMSHQVVVWNDKTSNPIEVLQVSRSKWRALNLEYTRTYGGEVRSAFASGRFELELAASQITSVDAQRKVSPRLPMWQGVLSPKYFVARRQTGLANQNSVTVSSLIRHQGPQYADAMNLVKLAPVTTVDLTLDWANFQTNEDLKKAADIWKGSLSILNVSNVIYDSFVVEDGLRSTGRMTRYGQGQTPLPGRQWVMRLERAF